MANSKLIKVGWIGDSIVSGTHDHLIHLSRRGASGTAASELKVDKCASLLIKGKGGGKSSDLMRV